jgi:glycine cleavage system aminomethyltransferase T
VTDTTGAIVNDPVLNRLEDDRYWFSAADSDLGLWIKGLACFAGMRVTVSEPDVAPIQIQGAKSRDLMSSLFGSVARELRYYHLAQTTLQGMSVVISRTGWSGDLGYEIYLCDTAHAEELWNIVEEAGRPFNLRITGPNTIRRVEAGIVAMRSDFPAGTTPYHLGMERLVDLNKPAEFIGKAALRRLAELVGIEFDSSVLANEAVRFSRQPVHWNGEEVGTTTVVVFSPRLAKAIGYARVATRAAAPGAILEIASPGGPVRGRVVPTPFFDPAKAVARQ